MVDEAEEKDDKNNEGVVREKVGNVLGYARGGVGDGGGEAQSGEVEELTPWTASSHDRLACFFEGGE